MYDTHLGQFLNADPIILDEQNSQNYALYSYVLNNPLKYTDPSGYTQQGGPASAAIAGQSGKMLQMQLLEMNNNINAIKEGAEQPFFLANGLVFLPAVGGSVFTYGMPNITHYGYLREAVVYGSRSGSNSNGFQVKSVSHTHYQLDFGGQSGGGNQSNNTGLVGFKQENVDFAGAVGGGLTTVFGTAAHYSDFVKAAGKVGVVGNVVTGFTYGHALATHQATPAHHLDAAITGSLIIGGLVSLVIPPIAPYVIGIGFSYGGIRLIGGAEFDSWFNSQFSNTPTLKPVRVKP